MVKIEIDGQPLVLLPGQKIRMKMRNPMMYDEVLPKYFTYPFTIPLDNGTNSFLLNYPQSWQNKNKLTNKFDCFVYLFGENNPRKSVLNIRSVSATRAECDIVVDKNVDDIGDKLLNQLDMGTVVLQDSIYRFIDLTLFGMHPTISGTYYSYHTVDTVLSINGILFTVAANVSNTQLSVMTDLRDQINANTSLNITASLVNVIPSPPNATLRLTNNLPGTLNPFVLDNLSELAANFRTGIFDTDKYYYVVEDTEAEWIDDHVAAVITELRSLISDYDVDTTKVTFPVVQNILFIDDDLYGGFQNSNWMGVIDEKKHFSFITPMLPLVFVMKEVFRILGYEATGTFLDDENVKRFILYSNTSADAMIHYYGSDGVMTIVDGSFTNPIYDIDRKINVHSSVITLSNHCPDISVKEFLTTLRTLFNLKYDYKPALGKVEVYISQTKTNALIQNAPDFTSKIVNKWQLINPNSKIETIKLFKFEEDNSDEKIKQMGLLDYQKTLVLDEKAKKEIVPKVSSICEEVVDNFLTVATVQIAGNYDGSGTPCKLKLLQYFGTYSDLLFNDTTPTWAKIWNGSGFSPWEKAVFALNKDSYPNFAYSSDWALRWDSDKGIYKKCWEKQAGILNDGVQLKINITLTNADMVSIEDNPFIRLENSIAVWKDIDIDVDNDELPPADVLCQLF